MECEPGADNVRSKILLGSFGPSLSPSVTLTQLTQRVSSSEVTDAGCKCCAHRHEAEAERGAADAVLQHVCRRRLLHQKVLGHSLVDVCHLRPHTRVV